MTFFWSFLSFVLLQRIIELIIAKRNERILRNSSAVEYDTGGYKIIVVMHILFFISLVTEKIYKNTELNQHWQIFVSLFICAQLLRYWAITSLGVRWNTKVFVLPGEPPVTKGPYKFMKHPNYIAVITEIAVIPLIFSCYITAICFSFINAILLNRRIKIEEIAFQAQK
jgi:methyltransferase